MSYFDGGEDSPVTSHNDNYLIVRNLEHVHKQLSGIRTRQIINMILLFIITAILLYFLYKYFIFVQAMKQIGEELGA